MDMKKLAAAVAVAGWTAAQAAVSVTNVTVQQRWPWNGKVDIDYEVSSDAPDDSIFVYPEAKENDRNIAIAPRTLTGDGVEPSMCGARVKPGRHRMTWHMDTDEPTLHSSSFTVTMHAVKGGMYLVVDLSGGPNAESYPIRYSDTPPDITDDACRTTNLWLRLCLPGTFMMGSPSDEGGREYGHVTGAYTYEYETLHKVTLTKPFYMGIFELTERQYALIVGTKPSSNGDTKPVVSIHFSVIRGAVAGAAYPQHSQVDPSSFLGLLRARTGCLFDLPTEAQWEYACRAGTSTAFNDGQDITISKVGYCGNTSIKSVGMKNPNSWGIYDMHGNVAERCLDWWRPNLGSGNQIDPVGPLTGTSYRIANTRTQTVRVIRGGAASSDSTMGAWQTCRSAARPIQYGAMSTEFSSDRVGFRVVATPVVQ